MNVEVPDHILELAERLRTQDNRATAHPIYLVQEHVEIVTFDFENGHGWEHDGEKCPIDWWPTLDTAEHEGKSTIQLDGDMFRMFEFSRYGVQPAWETVITCLTEHAAQAYIEANKHNLMSRGSLPPRIYVGSLHRCREMIQLREWLLTIESTT